MKVPAGPNVRLWRIWTNMRNRCSPKSTTEQRKNYADRGIRVCAEWQSFEVFSLWATANGYADHLSIDRRDNDGNYEPANCHWTTPKVQSRNTRRTVRVKHNGEEYSLPAFVETFGIEHEYARLYTHVARRKMSLADALASLGITLQASAREAQQ